MAAEKEVTLVIRARDRTRAVFRRLRRGIGDLLRRGSRLAAGLGAGLGAGAVAIGRSAEDLENGAALLGISAEELQAAQRVLARGGIRGLSESVDVLRDLSVRAAEARRESGEAREGFQLLGVAFDDLAGDPLQILGRLQQAVRELRGELTDGQIRQALDQIGGDALVELLPALLRGGNIRTEIQQIADSDTVRSNEAVATSAEASRVTQEQLSIALARLVTLLEAELPRLIVVLERGLDAYDEAFPGGVGATARGTFEGSIERASRGIEGADLAARQALRGSPLGLAAQFSAENIARLLEAIEANTRDGGTLN